jgi:hypothetical protein
MVDVTKVRPPETFIVSEGHGGGTPIGVPLEGAPGAAPANTLVVVTNLDSTDEPLVTTTRGDGSFSLTIPVGPGDELRFESVSSGRRSPPSDALFPEPPGARLVAVSRFECLSLEPGFSLDLTGENGGSVVLRNRCDDAVEVDDPRFRTENADFALSTALPLEIAARGTATLEFAHTPASGSASEVVVFIDVTLSGETLRYPITLHANAR